MMAISDDPKTRLNRLRRAALRKGYVLTKARGVDTWFLERNRQVTVYYNLDDVEVAVEALPDARASARASARARDVR